MLCIKEAAVGMVARLETENDVWWHKLDISSLSICLIHCSCHYMHWIIVVWEIGIA